MIRIMIFLFLWTILQGCKVFRPATDIGKQDLFTDGLSPDYIKGSYRNYVLEVKPEQIARDTIFKYISSRAFTSIRQKDGTIGSEKPNVYPADNWNAYLDGNGYVLKTEAFAGNYDSIWNTTSYSYTFAGSNPIQVIQYSSRFRTENIKYSINYNRRGLISRIVIATHRDSLIVQRTYQYSRRKLTTYTIDGNKDTVERAAYVFGRNNNVIEQTEHFILKGTVKKSKVEYSTDSSFTTKWDELDRGGQVVASGYERHLNSLNLERDSDFYSNWKNTDYVANVYNKNNSLLKTARIYSGPSQRDTIITSYTYQIDLGNRLRKTVRKYDCSKCKGCGNCEYINAVVVKYE